MEESGVLQNAPVVDTLCPTQHCIKRQQQAVAALSSIEEVEFKALSQHHAIVKPIHSDGHKSGMPIFYRLKHDTSIDNAGSHFSVETCELIWRLAGT